MDIAKIVCVCLFISFVILWVLGGILMAVYVTKDDRMETVEVYGITKEYHFFYHWKTFEEANQTCEVKGLKMYQPYDTKVHLKVHELVQTLKFAQYWIYPDMITDFRKWNDNEPKNVNQCVVGGLKNAQDETSPYWGSFKCSDQAQVICEDLQMYSDPEPGNFSTFSTKIFPNKV